MVAQEDAAQTLRHLVFSVRHAEADGLRAQPIESLLNGEAVSVRYIIALADEFSATQDRAANSITD